ncbi:MAG: hypothetical protein JSR49_09410 [Proteobacteria bacterium]|nr:hypothetical protein [Pseudomonadota bacterium]
MQAQKLEARQHKRAQDSTLRAFHRYVHEQLQSERKDEILRRARARIGLWKQGQLCSDYYIRFWSQVVNSGDSEVFKQRVLQASERQALGMMQNTPFSFLMREVR